MVKQKSTEIVKQLKNFIGNSFTNLDFHVDVVVNVDKLSQIFEFVKWWNISNVLTGFLTDILF